MLCNRRPGSSAPRFVRSSFSDEVLIRVIKISVETSEMDSFLFNTCKVPGCSEGYISVDGLEKVCRTMCAAPKEKIHASKQEGNFIKCCTNTPTLGGKSQKASKYCWEHLHIEGNNWEVDRTRKRDNVQYRSKGLQHYTHITRSAHTVSTHLTRKYFKLRVITCV